ncbi:alternative RNA polymerase sigma factor SIGI [Mycobacterium tuberculosis]|nr:alternative RNA polymerase sigma factor SIGI [Mycobacterium tuberculosis]
MSQHDPVSAAWRAHRAYLVDLAFRMVGDIGVAEDMVQEAFSRLLRAPVGDIDDERGWLIVVTSRLCLDHIKSASTRRERPQDIAAWHDGDASVSSVDPADRVTLDDEVRLALLIMLERLGPAERVVFVLHEIFGLGGVTPVAQDGRANPIRAHDDNAFAGVDLAGDTRIQHLEQGVQVSVGAGFDESSGDDAMLGWLHAGRNARFVDLATGPMSQLPACGGLAANRRGDLLVGQPSW